MTKDKFTKLIEEFRNIYRIGYVKSTYKSSYNAAGITFEHLLNKKEDSKSDPDYDEIELKTTMRYSHFDIGLLSISFDGPNKYESYELTMEYARHYSNCRYLNEVLPYHTLVKINDTNYFEFDISEENERFQINIYNNNKILISQRGFISFEALKERLLHKLKYLALIYVSKKNIDNTLHFRYYNLICYEYNNFDKFIYLLKNHIINPTIMLKYYIDTNSNFYQNNHNKNIVFKIKKDNFKDLFTEIYDFNGK